jgi:energy-coupling factor transporter ATP-binding protein EcfA2
VNLSSPTPIPILSRSFGFAQDKFWEGEGQLLAEEVAFAYPQEGRGLQPVSLRLSAGEIVHISSPSGGGKSTLARCLTGLIPHLYHGNLKGSVWIHGLRTDRVPMWRISETAGLVFQNPAAQMLAVTVEDEIIFGLENLGLYQTEIDQRVAEAQVRFDLEALRGRSPLTLSGGEQQKLALAAIMARKPPVLVLDEPLSMLDTTSAFNLVAHLRELADQGIALVICEHRKEYLKDLPNLLTVYLNGSTPTEADRGEIEWPGQSDLDLRLEAKLLRVERGGSTILDGWSFVLHGGQVTAILGRNGVGKTTLLRSLAGLQPFTGDLAVYRDGQRERPDLGMVFQNPDLQLFNATVREEILYRVSHPDPGLYHRLLSILDLTRYENTPPLLLSEGEKRRVALATILMHGPQHGVLLDEPALGQDSDHKSMLVHLLRALAKTGQMAVFATHDIELASKADRLILLGHQGLQASGSPEELLKHPELWQQVGLHLPEWVRKPC